MSAVLHALLFALAAADRPAHADAAACAKAFKPETAREWGMTATAWNAACAKGLDADDVLRQAQRTSMAACVAKFLPYEAKGKVPTGQTQAFCAQGSEGRAHLAAVAGLPSESPPKPAAPPPPRQKPGGSALGPVGDALAEARAGWKGDACLMGLHYLYEDSGLTTPEEAFNAWQEKRAIAYSRIAVETYDYYFVSDSVPRDFLRVTFADHLEPECAKLTHLRGPDKDTYGRDSLSGACLGAPALDVAQAIAAAEQNGWTAASPLEATLVTLPKGYFGGICPHTDKYKGPVVDCGILETWDKAKLRRVTGKPVWVLSSAGKTAFVDAVSGRFRYLAPGATDLPVARSLVIGKNRCAY